MKLTLLITNLLFVFFAISAPAFSQDIIFLKNGDEIKASVSEIGTDVVKYKKFENLQGPDYALKKSEVFMIKYANGTKDIFNSPAETPAALSGTEVQTFTDARDGKVYKTVTIGSQTWMAENLNYGLDFSWCNGNTVASCKEFGRLYTWETAKMVCPSGWHLPSQSEFETLLSNIGSSDSTLFQALKEGGSSGFNAVSGGWRNGKGQYGNLGKIGHLWSSSEGEKRYAWGLTINYEMQISRLEYLYRDWGLSVRCVKD